MNRIERRFSELKKNKKKAFIAFITAGYPSLSITEKLIRQLEKSGVDIVELGVPFSDPMADGQIIQAASRAALKRKVNLTGIFNLVKSLRKHSDIPVCLMTYYNPVFCFGQERFMRIASLSGVDGLIIPDLPPEEDRALLNYAAKYKIDVICFISPTTSIQRIKYITSISRGFIYYVSLTGVTGTRNKLSPGIISRLKLIKRYTDKPVCVGFGVSNASQVRQIEQFADGVIVGSAIIKKINENITSPSLVNKVGNFVSSLKGKPCIKK
ncbi:MAG: tryptophan synthase subunit alpha [Candidatus Omnitrophota bacterium]